MARKNPAAEMKKQFKETSESFAAEKTERMGTDMRDRVGERSGGEWPEETRVEERRGQVQEEDSRREEEENKNILVVQYLRDRGVFFPRYGPVMLLACPQHGLTLNSSACWTFGSSQIKGTQTLSGCSCSHLDVPPGSIWLLLSVVVFCSAVAVV